MVILISVLFTTAIASIVAAILFPQAVQSGSMRFPKYLRSDKETLLFKASKNAGVLQNRLEYSGIRVAQRILTSPSIRANTEDRLKRARMDGHVTAVEYIFVRIMLAFLTVSTSLVFSFLFRLDISEYFIVLMAFAAFQIPDYLLEQRSKRLDDEIARELPHTIDMLLICSESGMGLMQALGIVAEKKGGLIGAELGLCLQETGLGIRLQEALHNMTKRCRARELQLFVNSITQALRMGTPIQGILRNISASMRDSERQRMENKIGSIPMKLTTATMIFFMPLIFIIVLFPSLLSFMQSGW
jgi:tight adherence protein C